MRVLVLLVGAALLVVPQEARGADELPPVVTRAGARLPANEMVAVVGPRLQLDTPPKFISGAAPTYPSSRLRRRQPGYAVIRYTVDESGRTTDFEIVDTDYRNFADRAVVAVKNWRFRPAMKDRRPVSCRVRTPFYYRVRR